MNWAASVLLSWETHFYAQFEEEGEYYRKELPTGEKYLVKVKVIMDENDMSAGIEDTIIKQLE